MIDLLLFLGISKFSKLITLDYQDGLGLMCMHTLFLNISNKYVLCNNPNTPLTYFYLGEHKSQHKGASTRHFLL
jgi:hypothetical protein